jgi:hypothetical protein
MKYNFQPVNSGYYREQSAFAVALMSQTQDVYPLPNSYNYPIALQNEIQTANKICNINDYVTIHYHNIFKERYFQNPLRKILSNDPKSIWLRYQLHELGLMPKSIFNYFWNKLSHN